MGRRTSMYKINNAVLQRMWLVRVIKGPEKARAAGLMDVSRSRIFLQVVKTCRLKKVNKITPILVRKTNL